MQDIVEGRLEWLLVEFEKKILEIFNIYVLAERERRISLFKKLEVYGDEVGRKFCWGISITLLRSRVGEGMGEMES